MGGRLSSIGGRLSSIGGCLSNMGDRLSSIVTQNKYQMRWPTNWNCYLPPIQPSLEKRSHQLIVTLYTLFISPSLHNQLVRTLFEELPVFKYKYDRNLSKLLLAFPLSFQVFIEIVDMDSGHRGHGHWTSWTWTPLKKRVKLIFHNVIKKNLETNFNLIAEGIIIIKL